MLGGIMNYAIEMDSHALIYIPSFIKIGLAIQKLTGVGSHIHTYTDSKVIS
jgi:hypothetical protein